MFGSLLRGKKDIKSATPVFINTSHVFMVSFELGWELDLQNELNTWGQGDGGKQFISH